MAPQNGKGTAAPATPAETEKPAAKKSTRPSRAKAKPAEATAS
jgi:hypothetical protein